MSSKLVLASSSPRRRELLALTGLAFEVMTPEVDETRREGEAPTHYVARLSQLKARAVAQQLDEAALVLAADTIVSVDGDILGKPRNADEARAMLTRLRGRNHKVYSAITLLDTQSGDEVTDVATTPVPMRGYSDAEMEAYIATGDPFDKAGSYAIQHRGFDPVSRLSGCFANVMGLPLCHVMRSIRSMPDIGANKSDLPQRTANACQSHLAYDCPVYVEVLTGRPIGHPETGKL